MSLVRPLTFVKFREIRPPHSLWEELFGRYPWFYVPSVSDIISAHGFGVREIFDRYRSIVPNLVPERWHQNYRWGQWEVISQVQFRSALNQDLVRLDKAIITIALTSAAVLNAKVGVIINRGEVLDPDSHDQFVIPSTFVVDGGERITRNEKLLKEVMKATRQRRIVFDEISKGYAVTEYIAREIVSVCQKLGEDRLDIRLLKDRRDGGKLVRPIPSQQLDLQKIYRFYGLTTDGS